MSGFIGECINMYSYIVLAGVLISWVQCPGTIQSFKYWIPSRALTGADSKSNTGHGGLGLFTHRFVFLLNMLAEAI